ncbi:BZ3500_MvSof-1268-A1-R1_Chr1-1g01030 [Microbotryum saponariae]|uniref:Autophagy-related protein 14 n=1 Tax=Microbotryum saponariae TaxID=289078 RepID=A0A2X0K957_9BASI|nr:BZ3500_MvSof-1268-A1-R1_Chr1-1g01030 [Microbotryum saponariae]SCZ93229.1 BZ3501_MvSof-1269-A2-R1_Chr1-1g00627 [Microbotryum saponariae]
MVLKRADSSASQWATPPEPASLDHDEIKQQVSRGRTCCKDLSRRLRHLSAVLVRNLTVEPRRSHNPTSTSPFLGDAPFDAVGPSSSSSSSLRASAPESSSGPIRPAFASDDLDLLVRNRRRRATSNASLRSKTGPSRSLLRDTLVEAAEEGVGVGSSLSPSKPERTSLRRSMTGDRRIRIQEENDELFGASVFDGDSATAQASKSHLPDEEQLEADDEVDVDEVGHTDYFSPSSPSEFKRRNRSSSSTSIASAGTTGSGSTIRPRSELDSSVSAHAPARTFSHSASNSRLPDTLASRTASRGRTSFFSDLQLAKEKRRRIELLHRRMVDSTIMLSLFRPREQTEDPVDPTLTRRPSTLPSPRPHRPRRSGSTASIPGRSASRGLALPSAVESAPPLDVLPPFFIAQPARKNLNPTFIVEPNDFLVDPETQDLDDWPGLQEEHVLVSLWTKRSEVGTDMDKGKAKEQNADAAKADWTVLVEWDVSLDGLVSLGRDPTQFSQLQPNTIIFAMADEYFTAPLPLRTRFRPFASDDNHSSSCSEDDSDGAANYSDPGAGGVSHSWRSRRRRRREEEEAEEARRMRKVLVERSLRETRMVKVADVEALLRFKRVEHERCENKRTLHEQKQRLGAIFGDADGEAALFRESEELQDQVDDLVAVRDDLRLDIAEIGSELEQRKDELRQRRIRLESARSMNEARAVGLDQQRASLRQSEGACAKIRRAIEARRAQLITLLTHMFPIEPVATDGSSLLFSILSIPLPNSTYPPNSSDDQLSSALGYAAQVVSALAAYIGVPLHYPIKCLGSRSAVIDPISMMRGPRAFPLYGKGVDKYRFDYGVFLLNKDIEQLMYSQGLTVIDLRNTLPNLKALVLALSFASAQAEFASLSLHPPARFPNLSASSTDPEQDLTNELEEASLSRPTVAREAPHATLTNGDGDTVPCSSNASERASESSDSDIEADSRSVDTMRTATASKPQSTPTSSSKIEATKPITAQEKQTTRTLERTPTCIASNGATTTAGSNGKVKATVKAKEGSSATKALRNSLWTAVGYGSHA